MLASPNMEAKSQLLSLKKPLQYGFISIEVGSWLFCIKYLWDSCFLLDPTLNTSLEPHLQKELLWWYTWDLGPLWTGLAPSTNGHAEIWKMRRKWGAWHNSIDYSNYCVLLFGDKLWIYFIKQSHLCFIMSKQPIELSSGKIELLSNTSLYCVTLNSNMHQWDIIRVVFKPAMMSCRIHFSIEVCACDHQL